MANNRKSFNTLYTHSTVESLHLGTKSRSPDQDEMVTWLQYPLEYTEERGYCSELFGSLLSSLGTAKREHVTQGVPPSLESGEKRAASAGPENAEDALALGAERVSGYVHSEGAEVFDKVRTIVQQTACLQSGSPRKKGSSDVAASSPFQPRHHGKRESTYSYHDPSRSQALANAASMADSYAAYGASHNSTCSRLMPSISHPVFANQAMQEVEPRKEAAGSPHLVLNLQGLRNKGSDVQGSSYSLVSEDHMQKGSFFHAACAAGDREPVKLASLSRGRHTQEAIDAEVVVPSCSGGSQTSGDMSSEKETSSMGKQKPELDYDYPSMNTEGDSAEIHQLNKRRSKRSRVAESHNLSEKRRRNRINERLKTLQELIPNSCKTDKASILDEAIEYLKALQSQLQMMSTRNGVRLPRPVIMPAGVQHLQGVHMAPFDHPVGIGLPLAVNGSIMGAMGQPGLTQGIDGTPYQAFPTPHFNLTSAVPVAFGSQPYPGMDQLSSEFFALQHASAQESYRHSQGMSNTEVSQQREILSTRGGVERRMS